MKKIIMIALTLMTIAPTFANISSMIDEREQNMKRIEQERRNAEHDKMMRDKRDADLERMWPGK